MTQEIHNRTYTTQEVHNTTLEIHDTGSTLHKTYTAEVQVQPANEHRGSRIVWIQHVSTTSQALMGRNPDTSARRVTDLWAVNKGTEDQDSCHQKPTETCWPDSVCHTPPLFLPKSQSSSLIRAVSAFLPGTEFTCEQNSLQSARKGKK